MTPESILLVCGIILLAIAALLGFVQYRYRNQPEAFARWRVVHAGGTGGAVQLLALGAVWQHLGFQGLSSVLLAVGLSASTWAFFLGPLANATGFPRVASSVNRVGSILAVPAYLVLPVALLF
jgi:hypothetical protein